MRSLSARGTVQTRYRVSGKGQLKGQGGFLSIWVTLPLHHERKGFDDFPPKINQNRGTCLQLSGQKSKLLWNIVPYNNIDKVTLMLFTLSRYWSHRLHPEKEESYDYFPQKCLSYIKSWSYSQGIIYLSMKRFVCEIMYFYLGVYLINL